MGFKDQAFSQRFYTLGDIAEGKFEEIAPLGAWERLGWNRPQVPMRDMGAFIRNMPDYYSAGYLIECMGLGFDGVLKLKLPKYAALLEWNRHQEVALFVWNSNQGEWRLLYIDTLKRLVAKARRRGVQAFQNDGNEYYPILWSDIEANHDLGNSA